MVNSARTYQLGMVEVKEIDPAHIEYEYTMMWQSLEQLDHLIATITANRDYGPHNQFWINCLNITFFTTAQNVCNHLEHKVGVAVPREVEQILLAVERQVMTLTARRTFDLAEKLCRDDMFRLMQFVDKHVSLLNISVPGPTANN